MSIASHASTHSSTHTRWQECVAQQREREREGEASMHPHLPLAISQLSERATERGPYARGACRRRGSQRERERASRFSLSPHLRSSTSLSLSPSLDPQTDASDARRTPDDERNENTAWMPHDDKGGNHSATLFTGYPQDVMTLVIATTRASPSHYCLRRH